MKAWLLNLLSYLRSSYWFIPFIMAVFSTFLAIGATSLDSWIGQNWVHQTGWLLFNQPEGARAILATIAGSMITVAGVTFSMTIVAVSFAMGQIGPSLIHNFMRDRANQFTLGTFISTFLYCLLVLRTVANAGELNAANSFIPHIAILIAILLAIGNVAIFIFFIHHVPESINISSLLARIAEELNQQFKNLYPIEIESAESEPEASELSLLSDFYEKSYPIYSQKNGYIRYVDSNKLFKLAIEKNCIIEIQHQVGTFVSKTTPLLQVSGTIDDDSRKSCSSCFAIGQERTQDVLFLSDEIAEIITRALSPGINSPFIAMTAVDWLQPVIESLAKRKITDAFWYDENNNLRLIANPISLSQFVTRIFGKIRPYVSHDPNALLHIMSVIQLMLINQKNKTLVCLLKSEAEQFFTAANEILTLSEAKKTAWKYLAKIREINY